MAITVNTKGDLLKAIFTNGTGNEIDIHRDFAATQFNDYKSRLVELDKHADLNAANLKKDFDPLRTKAKKLADLKEDLAHAPESMKSFKEEQIKTAERELQEAIREKSRDFKEMVRADEAALKSLGRDRELLGREIKREVDVSLREFKSAIEKERKAGKTHFSGFKKGHIDVGPISMDAAEKQYETFTKQYEHALEKVERHLSDVEYAHEKLRHTYTYLAQDVKAGAGHDLLAGVEKAASKSGSLLEGSVNKVIKAEEELAHAGTGASLAIVGGGAALGAVVGHQFDGKEGGHMGSAIGALTGGGIGFAFKHNLARMLNIASHTRA